MFLMDKDMTFVLNGNETTIEVADHWTLLYLLREKFGLLGTKEGCGSGECGACTVIVAGVAINACLYLAVEVAGKSVLTIEGLASKNGDLHPLQKSFIENGGIQCGFCSPGMILSAAALLEENPDPDDDEIKHAIAGNICRCTGYVQIVDSIKKAAQPETEAASIVAWQNDSDTIK
jgi:carbon-monoxide dehydrogenase small subunit